MSQTPCVHKRQWDNFCSSCGTALKERCTACGNMEPIGRAHCAKAVRYAKKELLHYENNRVGMHWWRFIDHTLHPGTTILLTLLIPFSLYFFGIICFIAFSLLPTMSVGVVITLLILSAIIIVFAAVFLLGWCVAMSTSKRRLFREQFLAEFPQYKGMVNFV
jgi:Flp pilus assembly protein TadB